MEHGQGCGSPAASVSALSVSALAEAVRAAALGLPPSHARRLASVFAGFAAPGPAALRAATSAVPTQALRTHATRIHRAWAGSDGMPGQGVALALCAAADAAEQLRAEQSVDVVWTGPSSHEVPVRLTREVLLDLVDEAERSLVLVSFAAYRVAELVSALEDAVGRGVTVRLVLELAADQGGSLSVPAAAAFAALGQAVEVWTWPPGLRRLPGGGTAAMHAKAAIADDRVALVTSANLTGHGVDHNMELGLLVRGGPVPGQLAQHVRSLMALGTLGRAVATSEGGSQWASG